MRSIAIPVADRKECTVALDTTFKLARSLGADVVSYHLIPDQEALAEISTANLWTGMASGHPVWAIDNEDELQKAAKDAETLFRHIAQKNNYTVGQTCGTSKNPKAQHKTISGKLPSQLFSSKGALHDLLVVSRPLKGGGQKAHTLMLSALLDTSTPVLVLPQDKARITGKNIVIAWNGNQPESLLVHATISLLQNASKVTFVTVGNQSGNGPSGEDMTAYLKAHGIRSEAVTVSGRNAAKALEDSVKDLKADLLLSGAYSRGRMREMVFGGVTEYLLTKTTVPVIMLHV